MASRTKGKEAARERAAAMRAAEQRADRRRKALLGVGGVGLVLLVVLALVIAKLAGAGSGDDATTAAAGSGSLPASVAKAITSVPAATFDEVGIGTAENPPKPIDAPALTADGKPKVLYVGAEYCPFCASQRWPVVVALSRFGTWSGLTPTTSASDDAFPDTPTLSFHGASYTSDYLSFTGVETETNERGSNGSYGKLDTLSDADQKTFTDFNKPPYVQSAGGIPFLNIGGTYVVTGASFSPELLKDKSRAKIAAETADPTSELGQAIGGSANVMTAALCSLTDQQPANVCGSPGVKAAAAQLAS
jgi:Domain of unknown function (DUF929)